LVGARAHRVHDVGAVCVRGGALAMWRPWLARMVRYDGRASRHANQCPKGWSLTKDELTSAWSKHGHVALHAGARAMVCRGATACVCRYLCPVSCVRALCGCSAESSKELVACVCMLTGVRKQTPGWGSCGLASGCAAVGRARALGE